MFYWHLREMAWAHHRLGDHARSWQIQREHTRRLLHADPEAQARVDAVIAEHGQDGYRQWILDRLRQRRPRPGYATWMAQAHAALGHDEEALVWLAQAVQERNLWFLLLQRAPEFDRLRTDPRYIAMAGDLPLWQPPDAGRFPP